MNYLQHISQVLSNRSAQGREGSAAYRKLEQFDAQFAAYGEGHWMLAAHAAFPMLLTPDLLYRIWHNFQTFQDAAGQDQLIDRVAVSDLLLSPLLREIGTEVFEMPGKIRSALLSCLEKRFEQSDPQRLYDLSQFLMQYYQYMPSGKNYIWDQMRDLQEWHAMAYMQPETAADQLREAMSDAVRSNQKGQQYRLQMLVEKLDQQFETLGKAERQDKSFQTLVAYTKGMQAFQEGEYQEAIESFADLPTVPAESEAGEGQDLFTITVPKAVQQELKKRDTEQPKGTLRANFVAINQYENISPLSAAVSDAERLKSWLQERVQNRPLEVQSLHDEAATEDAITGMLINTLEQAQPEDTVLFYFAGTGVELSQNGLQGPRSVFAGVDFQLVRDQPVGGISDQDMRNILQEYNRNNAFVCILFDACNVGTASWIDIDNPRQIMLSASRLQEKAFEIRTGGAFTTALLDILNAQEVIPNMNSLSMAIRDEVQRQFEEQTPQLFGHYQARLRTFLNLGESREEDLLTRAFQEMDLWQESLSTSIHAFVERSELIDQAALLPWMSTFSTLKSTDQLEVLNLTGMDFVRLFRNITSELTSPVIRYQTENMEELDLPGYGNIVPPTNIQQQSNLGSYSLDSEPEKRDYYSLILQPDVVTLPLNEWMVQQLSQNAELHDALMERWMRDRPVIPILMEACTWENTIAVRFAGQLLQTSPPEGPEAQRAQYEQSLKTYLGLWWQAQLMDLRKQIEDGRLSRVFMSLKNKLPSDSVLQETLVSLEEVIEKVDAPGTKGSTTEGNPQDIQAIYDELNAFLEQITVDDFFENIITFEAESGYAEQAEVAEEMPEEDKPFHLALEESIDPEEQEALRGLFSESDTIFDLKVPLASAEYSLSVEDGMYLLKEEGEVVVVTNREDQYLLLEKINHFFRWKYLLTVENLGAINAGDYEIEFFVSRTEEDASQNQFDPIDWQDGLDFEAEPSEEGYYNIWLRAKVTNRSRRALHCTALYLSQEYIINPQMLNNRELGPREEAWLIEGRNIRVNPEVEYKQGRPTLYHNTDFIKFFFSREPMPLDGFRQESIHQLPEARKVLPSNDMSLPRVDWTSEVVNITVRLPEEEASVLETFKQELKEQIVRAKEWEVIEALLNRTLHTASSRDQVLIFANWYQFVQQNLNNGTITNDSATREFTRLRSDLLSYINTLNEEDILEENVPFFELAGAKNQLKQQIAKGEIRQVLLELEDQIDEGGEEGVLMLMAEYNGLQREIDRGTIDFISIRTTRERILKQLLVLLKSNFYPKEPVNPEFEDRTELTAFQKEVRQLLAEGHIDRPVEIILQRINPAADIYDDFIGLLHWYRFVERQFSLGMVSQQDAMVDQNNIRQAILQLITAISPADLEEYGKVDKYLEEVRRILSEGKLKEALDFLSSIPQLKKEVVILQQNFSKLNRETVIGTLGYAEIRTRRNRIARNALELVSGFFDV